MSPDTLAAVRALRATRPDPAPLTDEQRRILRSVFASKEPLR